MKPKAPRNIAASHRAKLLNLAQERGEGFQFFLGRWVSERFLFRLGRSAHRDQFILKGAMMFVAWDGKLHRPTQDVDLLGYGNPELAEVARRIREICAEAVDDGIVFDLEAIRSEKIREDAEYEGVRVRVPASLDGARVLLQVDIGFGDLVEPPAAQLTFPVLLPLDPPIVRGYSPETVIAEKFQAMVVLGIGDSRMKDFFDLWTLARTHNFRLYPLHRSVRQTFERRRTPFPTAAPVALTDVFLLDENKQTQWKGFGNRSGLELPTLRAVGAVIEEFVRPILMVEDGPDLVWTAPGPWR
ncbi:MAG TPA: nucleotidyl transferase AbiEii/AbiGii toxin family protein [Candidatus Dormibacteraeota bacterium]|nr:nucleotidyl transferase AbiEii/AbiGii toxin family protein [Candidatus Dormibacteraeota bacterium]